MTVKGRCFTVRPACPEDGPAIAQVQAVTWQSTYIGLMPQRAIQERLDRLPTQGEYLKSIIKAGQTFLVAEAGEETVGFAGYGRTRNERFPEDGEIYALYVLPEFQGRGLGRALFEGCAARLKEAGYRSFILNCLAGNTSALEFYAAMGGRVVGMRTDQVPGGEIEEKVLGFS